MLGVLTIAGSLHAMQRAAQHAESVSCEALLAGQDAASIVQQRAALEKQLADLEVETQAMPEQSRGPFLEQIQVLQKSLAVFDQHRATVKQRVEQAHKMAQDQKSRHSPQAELHTARQAALKKKNRPLRFQRGAAAKSPYFYYLCALCLVLYGVYYFCNA